jgi:hypothetical protein
MIHAGAPCCGACASVAAPAERKALLYGLLAAGGWATESGWAIAIGLGGLIAALVDLATDERNSTC